VRGRIIVDAVTCYEEVPVRRPVIKSDGRILESEMRESGLSDVQALLCPNSIAGLSLDEDTWFEFFVHRLSPVYWTPNMWADLVIDGSQKEDLKDLVGSHDPPDDPHNVKDLGLVFLLHGHPGTGKTLTVGKKRPRPL
jgi:hypothetical protein